MLVNLKKVLAVANEKNIAIGAFNTPNLENMIAVIETAEKYDTPVIIMHAQLHEDVVPMKTIAPVMLAMAENARVPVCVHLDHCDDLDYLYRALDLGFTSVMYDGSLFPYEKNVKNTRCAVEKAKQYNANVEAEIGVLGGREAGAQPQQSKIEDMYTDPELAKRFVEDTQIDALAASFGTAHGFYKEKPKLDFERVAKISELVKIPLVMHGGSGVSPEDYIKAIDRGVRKIDYYSYMARAGVQGVKSRLESGNVDFFHELAQAATESMQTNIEMAIRTFLKLNTDTE
ncbi:MAG: Fructose-bisphosphate aldolase [Clostridium sp.]|jgi:fructose-bisphosphate aldolase, class II